MPHGLAVREGGLLASLVLEARREYDGHWEWLPRAHSGCTAYQVPPHHVCYTAKSKLQVWAVFRITIKITTNIAWHAPARLMPQAKQCKIMPNKWAELAEVILVKQRGCVLQAKHSLTAGQLSDCFTINPQHHTALPIKTIPRTCKFIRHFNTEQGGCWCGWGHHFLSICFVQYDATVSLLCWVVNTWVSISHKHPKWLLMVKYLTL